MAQFPTSPIAQRVQPMEAQWRTLVSQFESGYEQRRAIWSKKKRIFTLEYDLLHSQDRDLLYTFWQSCQGAYASFSFVYSVTQSELQCRFDESGWSEEKYGSSLFKLMLKLKELF